jgi:hypothetical protein
MMATSHIPTAVPGAPPALQAQVEEVVHKAFWDAVRPKTNLLYNVAKHRVSVV